MSRYEQVCDMIRQRRIEKRAIKSAGHRYDGEVEFLSVIEDSLREMTDIHDEVIWGDDPETWRAFEADIRECRHLRTNPDIISSPRQRERCLVMQWHEDEWPLQTEADA